MMLGVKYACARVRALANFMLQTAVALVVATSASAARSIRGCVHMHAIEGDAPNSDASLHTLTHCVLIQTCTRRFLV